VFEDGGAVELSFRGTGRRMNGCGVGPGELVLFMFLIFAVIVGIGVWRQ
jgi:hypothetical protein